MDNASVDENDVGGIIGRLTVTDPDSTTGYTYMVSDDRFEVVNDELKLKDGVALDYEQETQVSLVITVTDTDGLSYTETFNIDVDDVGETFVVTTLVDVIDDNDGLLSLREALMHANADVETRDTIVFADNLQGTIRSRRRKAIRTPIWTTGRLSTNRTSLSMATIGSRSPAIRPATTSPLYTVTSRLPICRRWLPTALSLKTMFASSPRKALALM